MLCGDLTTAEHPERLRVARIVEPRQLLPHLICVDAAPWDKPHVGRLAREDRRARKAAKIGVYGSHPHLLLPAVGQHALNVKGDPAES